MFGVPVYKSGVRVYKSGVHESMSDVRERVEFVLLLFVIALIVITFVICWLIVDYYVKQFVGMMDAAINVTRDSVAPAKLI